MLERGGGAVQGAFSRGAGLCLFGFQRRQTPL